MVKRMIRDPLNSNLASAVKKLRANRLGEVARDNLDHAALVAEYLHRVAALNERCALKLRSPFFNPLEILRISGERSAATMSELIGSADPIPLLKDALARRVCHSFLQWNEGVDEGADSAVSDPQLFDPLITLFMRGGRFDIHHGELLVGDSAIPLRNWRLFSRLSNSNE